MTEYTPDEEHMEVAWIQYDDATTDVNEAAAEFDRFLSRVKRDAAREALDGLADQLNNWAEVDAEESARAYRDTHYPEETQ